MKKFFIILSVVASVVLLSSFTIRSINNNHSCDEVEVAATEVTCSGCNKKIGKGGNYYQCDKCGNSICEDCHRKGTQSIDGHLDVCKKCKGTYRPTHIW